MFAERKLRIFIVALICFIIGLHIFEFKIKNSTLFILASDFFKNDERVSGRIGEVKTLKLNLLGTKLWLDKAKISLKLSGDNDNLPAWACLKKVGNEWIVYEAGIMTTNGIKLNWIPLTVETPEGAFYALKQALDQNDYDKAWSYISNWAKGTQRPDFETFKKMAEDKNSLVYAIKEADIIHSIIKYKSAIFVVSTGITYMRMELVKENGIWKVDGWMELEKEGVKKIEI